MIGMKWIQRMKEGAKEKREERREQEENDRYRRSLPIYPIAQHLADIEKSNSEGSFRYWSPGLEGRERIIGHRPPLDLKRSDWDEYERLCVTSPKLVTLRTNGWGRALWHGGDFSFEMLTTDQTLFLYQWRHLTWLIEIQICSPVQGNVFASIPREDLIRFKRIVLTDSVVPYLWERKVGREEISREDREAILRMCYLINRADYEMPRKKDTAAA